MVTVEGVEGFEGVEGPCNGFGMSELPELRYKRRLMRFDRQFVIGPTTTTTIIGFGPIRMM